MKAELIALDIDGTILDKPGGIPLHADVREAVRDARRSGACVCLCSSRPAFFMKEALRGLDGVDAQIGCSGAMIEMGGEPVYMDRLPPSLLHGCFETAGKLDAYVSFAGRDRIFTGQKGPVGPPDEHDPIFITLDNEGLLDVFRDEPLSCCFIFTNPGTPDDAVPGEPALASASVHRSSGNCYVVTNPGTDKGSGLLRLAGILGVRREAILAVGNDESDVPMLRAAGVGVAVANARPEALAAADWIAPDVAHGGAAEAIRRFAL